MKDFLELLSPTRRRIVQITNREGSVTISYLAGVLELAKTTVRQHLARLEHQGLLSHESVPAGRGRPVSVYQLTRSGSALFPSQDGRVMREFVEHVLQQGHLELVDDFFRRLWRQLGDELSLQLERAGAESLEQRLEVLEQFLNQQGFVARVDLTENQATIREHNCPFAEGVGATKLLCRLERELLERILQRELVREGHLADGDPACVYRLAAVPDET